MSVKISNMKMPGSCFNCRFLHGIHRAANEEGEKVIYVGCAIDGGEMMLLEKNGRRADCPLEEAD